MNSFKMLDPKKWKEISNHPFLKGVEETDHLDGVHFIQAQTIRGVNALSFLQMSKNAMNRIQPKL